jgi:phosphoglycerate dehydrogenase-like enzyme
LLGLIKPTLDQVKDVNVIIGNIPVEILKNIPDLEFVQLNSAGINGYSDNPDFPKNVSLANAAGAYGVAISECILAGILTLMKHIPSYIQNQSNHKWKDEGKVKSIYNSQILILGLGDIGKEFSKRAYAMGAHITGIKRNIKDKPEYVDKLCTMDSLYEELEKADIIVSSLPGSKSTYHLFDKEALTHVKKQPIFVNVGRGSLIDSSVLEKALKENIFSGAYIDVTDSEPLPKEDELWNLNNLIITPHVTGGYHLEETLNRIVEISATNIQKYCEGKEIINKVNLEV